MKHEPGIFEVEDPLFEAEQDARAAASIAAGRVVPNADVIAWLKDRAAGNRRPAPQSWRR